MAVSNTIAENAELRCAVCFSDLDSIAQFSPLTKEADCVGYIKCTTCTVVVCSHCILKMNKHKLATPLLPTVINVPGVARYCSLSSRCAVSSHELFDSTNNNQYKIELKRTHSLRARANYLVLNMLMAIIAKIVFAFYVMMIGSSNVIGSIFYNTDASHFYADIDLMAWMMVKFQLAIEIYTIVNIWCADVSEVMIPVYSSIDPMQRISGLGVNGNELMGYVDINPPYGIGDGALYNLILNHLPQLLLFSCKFLLGDAYSLTNTILSSTGLMTIEIFVVGLVMHLDYMQLVRIWSDVIRAMGWTLLFELALRYLRFGSGFIMGLYVMTYFGVIILKNASLFGHMINLLLRHPQIIAFISIEKPKISAPDSITATQDPK